MNKLTNSMLFLLLVMAFYCSSSAYAASAEDNGLINKQFDEINIYGLISGECENLPTQISDISFDNPPNNYVKRAATVTGFSLANHQAAQDKNWLCWRTFADSFAGDIYIPATEDVTFYLNSDDGSKLWINGSLVIDNDGVHNPAIEKTAVLNLTQGWHYIKLHYFHNGAANNANNNMTLSLNYSSNILGARQPIPEASLRLGGAFDSDNDGLNDFEDSDDDNDGFLDSDEIVNGTSTLDASDVPADADGDFVSDLTDIDDDNDNLIELYSLNDLNEVRNNLDGSALFASSAGCASTCNGFELMNGLSFDTSGDSILDSNDDYWNDGNGFISIGSAAAPFNAIFEGNNNTIKYLLIESTQFHQGLFGAILDSEIRNLKLEAVKVSGGSNVGGAVGFSTGSIISNVSASGHIHATVDHIGGLLVIASILILERFTL